MKINFGLEATTEHKIDVLQNLVGERVWLALQDGRAVGGEIIACVGENVFLEKDREETAFSVNRVLFVEIEIP